MPAPAASGIFKQIRINAEDDYGVARAAGDTNAYILRRVTSSVSPNIAQFKSNEIRPDRQLVTARHGTQQMQGTLRGELSPTSYADIFASLLAGAWTAGASFAVDTSGTTITYVAAASGVPATITRASGSWITAGLKWGDLFKQTGSSVLANNSRNFRILGLTATVITVSRTPSSTADAALVNASLEALAAGSDSSASVTYTVLGKKLQTPDPFAGGTLLDPSFTLEEYYADQSLYELYTGNKPTDIRMSFVPSGMSTFESTFLGQKVVTGSGQYFTAAAGAATTEATTGVSGIVRVDDIDIGLVTNLQLNMVGGHTADGVIGTPYVPFVFPGIIDCSGSMSILFYDQTFFTAAINETEVDLLLLLTLSPGVVNTDALTIRIPRLKLGSPAKDDGPKAIVGTYPFQSLKYTAGGDATAWDNSTVIMQDTTL